MFVLLSLDEDKIVALQLLIKTHQRLISFYFSDTVCPAKHASPERPKGEGQGPHGG